MESKEKWVERVLQSSAEVSQLDQNPFLMSKIKSKLKGQQIETVRPVTIRLGLASLSFVIAFNVFVLFRTHNNQTYTTSEITVSTFETTQDFSNEELLDVNDYALLDQDFELNYYSK